jgi:hypothetical protein
VTRPGQTPYWKVEECMHRFRTRCKENYRPGQDISRDNNLFETIITLDYDNVAVLVGDGVRVRVPDAVGDGVVELVMLVPIVAVAVFEKEFVEVALTDLDDEPVLVLEGVAPIEVLGV